MRRRWVWDQKQHKLIEQKIEPSKVDLHYVMPDTPGYYSVATRRWVDGRHQRREDLKIAGCREVDPSEKKDFMAKKDTWQDIEITRADVAEAEFAAKYPNDARDRRNGVVYDLRSE